MAYQLQDPSCVGDEIRRIAYEQIETILKQLSHPDADQEAAVHNARKSLKKLRALLRLVQNKIGREQYQQENACFRDAGRFLSEMRDAQVRLETLDKLTAHFTDELADDYPFAGLRQTLMSSPVMVQSQPLREQDAVINAVALVKAAEQRVRDWRLAHSDWSMLRSGLKQVYRQGAQRFDKAFENPSVERLHDWRKRAKDLWYFLRLLKPIWPGVMAALDQELKLLGDYLGDDHDLAILRQTFTDQPEASDNRRELELLVTLIDRRRSELQLASQRLGQRLYAEKPSAFVKRLETYWQVWQLEAAQPMLVEV